MSEHPLSPQSSTFLCGVCSQALTWSPPFGLYWCEACQQWRGGPDDTGEAGRDLRDALQTLVDSHGWQRVQDALKTVKETGYPEGNGDE